MKEEEVLRFRESSRESLEVYLSGECVCVRIAIAGEETLATIPLKQWYKVCNFIYKQKGKL